VNRLNRDIAALEAQITAESAGAIKVCWLFTEPVWNGDKRIGSRVWSTTAEQAERGELGIELEEGDPRFRASAV
jgi:hypothetical protein